MIRRRREDKNKKKSKIKSQRSSLHQNRTVENGEPQNSPFLTMVMIAYLAGDGF